MFGSTGGVRRNGTQCLSGTNTAEKVDGFSCSPGCLFNITADPSELHNLYGHSKHAALIDQLKQKLKRAGSKAPAPASYFQDPTVALNQICEVQVQTGFLEPLGITT